MKKQVDKTHYDFLKYVDRGRWNSFYAQIEEILGAGGGRVLEVGVGTGVVGDILKKSGVDYKSVDIDEELKPDYVGSVLELPFADGEFDVVCAFQVLEHLPFSEFEKALGEMMRVARKSVIVSLPEATRVFKLGVKIPGVRYKKIIAGIGLLPRKHVFDGQHYWEIGKRETPLGRVREEFRWVAEKAGFRVAKDYRLFDNTYHRFFVANRTKAR